MGRRFLPVLLSIAVACSHPKVGLVQPEPSPAPKTDSGEFTVRQGRRVVATERFRRSADSLTGALLIGGETRLTYRLALGADGAVAAGDVDLLEAPPGRGSATPSPARVTLSFLGDSVTVTTRRARGTVTRHYATGRGAVFYVNPSFALVEQAVRRARAAAGREARVPMFLGGAAGTTLSATVAFAARDSARVLLGPAEVYLRVDDAGRVLGARVPSQAVEVTRGPLSAPIAAPAWALP
jgi:hypothetical protein